MNKTYECCMDNSVLLNDDSLTDKIHNLYETTKELSRICTKDPKDNGCMYLRRLLGYNFCLVKNYEVGEG